MKAPVTVVSSSARPCNPFIRVSFPAFNEVHGFHPVSQSLKNLLPGECSANCAEFWTDRMRLTSPYDPKLKYATRLLDAGNQRATKRHHGKTFVFIPPQKESIYPLKSRTIKTNGKGWPGLSRPPDSLHHL
jgi:hypothetical protein